MRTLLRKFGTVSALTLLGISGANASILNVTAAGGSEALLSVVDGTGASVTLDIGDQVANIAGGNTYSLTSAVTDFIAAAGGLSGVKFALISGSATNGTSAAQYLNSSDNSSLTSIANGVRGTWYSKLSDYITKLNTIDGTAGNLTYGPISSGSNGNYVSPGGYDDWGTAGTCISNNNVCNLVAGDQSAFLYLVNFGTAPAGFATIDGIGGIVAGAGTAATAHLDLATSQLVISSVVPVPAAAWLFVSAMGLLRVTRRRV
jgi:hypothetical protein